MILIKQEVFMKAKTFKKVTSLALVGAMTASLLRAVEVTAVNQVLQKILNTEDHTKIL